MVGIVGYGAYIPRYRIKVEEIAKVWGADAESYKKGLLVQEKSVPGLDQDTISMSVEAARWALSRSGNIDPSDIEAVYVGSESHPYAVKPSGTVVAEAIGATPLVHCANFEFACKAGSEAMFVGYSEVKASTVRFALAIGADTAQGAPGDALEYTAAGGAAAFIFGTANIIATVEFTHTYMTDTPDFWRREHQFYPGHSARFTGEPAYFRHIVNCGKELLAKTEYTPKDFAYAVFHQPNGKFPMIVARRLGFTMEQIETGLLVTKLGNTYSASTLMGLTAILDVARPGDLIFMVSFGSGAGSDGFIFSVTERILDIRNYGPKTREMLDNNPIYVSYGEYVKMRRKIHKA